MKDASDLQGYNFFPTMMDHFFNTTAVNFAPWQHLATDPKWQHLTSEYVQVLANLFNDSVSLYQSKKNSLPNCDYTAHVRFWLEQCEALHQALLTSASYQTLFAQMTNALLKRINEHARIEESP